MCIRDSLHFATQIVIRATGLRQKGSAFVRLAFERGRKEFIDFSPTVGFHPQLPRKSCDKARPWLAAIRVSQSLVKYSGCRLFPRCLDHRNSVTLRSCLFADRSVRE